MPEETLSSEAADAANLSSMQRGQLAELIFMRKASSLGFSVSKPWGEGERYDVIIRMNEVFWRVQVKSVLGKSPCKSHYRIKTSGGNGSRKTYSPHEIDFLAGYIFKENLWYVFPATLIENRKAICVRPGSKRSSFEQYREAWSLVKPPVTEIALNGISLQAVALETTSVEKTPIACP